MAAKSKAEIAMMYFPELTKERALQAFRRLIKRDPVLKNEMYTADILSSHILSPKTIHMIYENLGEPQDFSNSRRFDRMDKEKKLFG
jgi:hypothetical protein